MEEMVFNLADTHFFFNDIEVSYWMVTIHNQRKYKLVKLKKISHFVLFK